MKIPLMNIHKGKQERVAFFSKSIEKIKRLKKNYVCLASGRKQTETSKVRAIQQFATINSTAKRLNSRK